VACFVIIILTFAGDREMLVESCRIFPRDKCRKAGLRDAKKTGFIWHWRRSGFLIRINLRKKR